MRTIKANHRYYLFILVAICLIIFNAKACHGFAFPLPKMPWDSTSSTTTTSSKSPIQANDKILVFGGTGGVGQLVTRKLRARENDYNVCVVARDAVKAKEILSVDDIDVIELNLVGDDKAADDELQSAMEGCTGIVISVGTTGKSAFVLFCCVLWCVQYEDSVIQLHFNLVCLYVIVFANHCTNKSYCSSSISNKEMARGKQSTGY